MVAALAAASVILTGCTEEAAHQPRGATTSRTAAGSYAESSDVALRQCLTEKGWKVEPQSDGGFEVKAPPEQQERYLSDLAACDQAFKRDHPEPVLTVADYKELYRQEIVTMHCLEKAGYPPPGTPISEQQYVDDYASGKAPSWYAYMAVGNASGETFAEVEKKCPQPSVGK